jgi:flagellar protein FliL
MSEAAPAAQAAPAAAAPKTKSKLPLIVIAAVVLCLAIGGGVYFFMSGKSHDAAKPEAKSAKQMGPKSAALYVKLDPPFVVNFEVKGLMRFLQISLEIMTRDASTAEKLKENEPVIRNDLLLLFGNQTHETISTREGKERLRSEAKETVAKIIAREGGDPKKVEELYFTSFVMQ